MLVVRTSLRPSSIHGVGVFAEEPIAKGQLVWVFEPRIDIRIPLKDLAGFPLAAQQFMQTCSYEELFEGERVLVVCADNGRFVNHSDQPNCIDSEVERLQTAARDIPVGEELTCNYYLSDLAAAEKLGQV